MVQAKPRLDNVDAKIHPASADRITARAGARTDTLTWFSPPVETVARGVAAEQSPATWSHRYDVFLLAFLRYAKYDEESALRRLENFCAFRSLPEEGRPEWFQYETLEEDLWRRIGELRYLIPLGSTFEGTFCVLIKADRLNLDVVSFHEVMCASQIWNDVMLLDPRVQIGGFIFLMDMSNVHLRDLQRMSDPHVSKSSCQYLQEALPLRVKKMIYFNIPDRIKPFYKVSNVWLSEDARQQVMVLNEGLQQAYMAVAGLQDVMPREYGGQNATIDEIYARNAHLLNGLWSSPPEILVGVDKARKAQDSKCAKSTYEDVLGAMEIKQKQQFYSTDMLQ
nr:unnamed protein product [Spirometra erinaceieuropaei]